MHHLPRHLQASTQWKSQWNHSRHLWVLQEEGEVAILMTAMMEAILTTDMKEEKEEIAMMMTAQEGVEIMIDPEKEKEAEAGAGMLDQEGADLEAGGQDALQLCQKCQL